MRVLQAMTVITIPKKDGDQWIDSGGVSWGSRWEWLFVGVLGGCGCGLSESIAGDVVVLLVELAKPHEERSEEIQTKYYEALGHWIAAKGLTEHGTSIGGAWLTEDGEAVLRFMTEKEL